MQQLATRALRAFVTVAIAFAPFTAGAAPTAPEDNRVVPRDAAREHLNNYNVGGALAIRDDVGYEAQSTSGPIRLDVGRITNESTTTTSGSIRVALFVSTTPTPTGTIYVIARSDVGILGPSQFFGPFSHTVPYLAPPDGTYYVHMGVFEYEPGICNSADGYCLDDYASFVNQVIVQNGRIFASGPPAPPTATVVEYYHTNFDHYFVTHYDNEIRLLDSGAFQGWTRTGRTFNVFTSSAGGSNAVCRFFSASFAPRSSHFYTPFVDECNTVRGNSRWTLESLAAFYVNLPDVNGNCRPGTQPLYRLYNNGKSGAPNHRYTISLDVRAQMLSQGWIPEGYGTFGVIACVP
ncbi:MAG TPA: hypothetical protein VNE58_17130 [Casimicrobiaceae bacterium]|nr:hypothetical protein [Casimicrobiaceae bacterium]